MTPLSDFEPTGYRTAAPPARAVEPAVSGAPLVACRFEAGAWSGDVHVAVGSESFATVEGAIKARIAIPATGAERGAPIELELSGLSLSALVSTPELSLYVTRARFWGGFVWALAGAAVRVERARAGYIDVLPRLPRRVQPVAPLRELELACGELQLATPDEPVALPNALFGARRAVRLATFRGDAAVPLSQTPRAKPLAFLDTRPEGPDRQPEEAIVLERRRHHVRIAYRIDALVIVGWVATDVLEPSSEETPVELISGADVPWGQPIEPFGGNDPTRVDVPDAPRTCAWNAPLAIEVAGTARTVGTLASGIPLLPLATRDGWREVQFSHPALSLSKGARAWVPERLLYPCTPRQ